MKAPGFELGTGALVLGGEYRGLGIVRSLGRRGIPAWVLTDENRIAAVSRYARRSIPWPRQGDRERMRFLFTLVSKAKVYGWTLFPTNDEDAAFVARHCDDLSPVFRLTTPHWDEIQWAYDKRLTLDLAVRAGVAHPWTYCPASRDDVAAICHPGPLILKPSVKVEFNAFTHAKAWPVRDREDLLRGYDAACRLVDPSTIMVQEVIPGSGDSQYSFAALCRSGVPVAYLTARRLRQYPVDFGRASTYVESIDCPEIERSSRRLIAAMGYSGLIEVEFKRDPRDGAFKLLDLNPRVWGWHSIGQLAGVDFPWLQWQMARGIDVGETRGRSQVRWIRLSTDLPASMRAILQGRITVGDYLRGLRGPIEFAMFAADDPLPAFLDVPLLLFQALKRGAA